MQQPFTKWHKNNCVFFSNYINDIISKGRKNIQRDMIALCEGQSINANICDVFISNTDYYVMKFENELSFNDLH